MNINTAFRTANTPLQNLLFVSSLYLFLRFRSITESLLRIIFEETQKKRVYVYLLIEITKTMSHSFNTFALKLKVHCNDCGVKLEKQLLNIKGVCSVIIDQELGKVVISGKVDPAKILSKLERRGRKAEFWPCEQLQVNDSDTMAQSEQLSAIPGLHTVEVTRTTRLIFQGQSTSNNSGITQFLVLPHGGGGRLCSVSSSCCGWHHGNTSFGSCYENNRNNCCYHNATSNNSGITQLLVLPHGGAGRLCSASSSSHGCHHGNTSFGSCYVNNRNNCSYHNVPTTQSKVLAHGGGFCSASSSCCGGQGGNYTSSGSCCVNNRNNYSCLCMRPPPMENRYIPDPLMIPPPWSGDRPNPPAPSLSFNYFQPPPSPPASSWASFLSWFSM